MTITIPEILAAAPLIVGSTWAICSKLTDVAAACRGLRKDLDELKEVVQPLPSQMAAVRTRLKMAT